MAGANILLDIAIDRLVSERVRCWEVALYSVLLIQLVVLLLT